MSFDDESAFLAELDRLLSEPPCSEDDPELREMVAFVSDRRNRKMAEETVRPGKKVGSR